MSLTYLMLKLKGGSGSGNFGHSGIPGHRGGSSGGKQVGFRLPTGTRLGGSEDADAFSEDSKLKGNYFWGTPSPGNVLQQGIHASEDEANTYPGISIGTKKSISEGYTGDNGKVFSVKINATNPIEFGDEKIKYDKGDVGDFYRQAHKKGYDAVIHRDEIRVFNSDQVLINLEG